MLVQVDQKEHKDFKVLGETLVYLDLQVQRD